jgi:hypothetical protein
MREFAEVFLKLVLLVMCLGYLAYFLAELVEICPQESERPVELIIPNRNTKFIVIKREYIERDGRLNPVIEDSTQIGFAHMLYVAELARRTKYAKEQGVSYDDAVVPEARYWVVNEDEPYAHIVKDLVLGNIKPEQIIVKQEPK